MKIITIFKSKKCFLLIFITAIFICLISFYFLNKERDTVLLIGLDGAGWKVMLPLVKNGELPNIKKMMDSGCWGSLETLSDSISEVIWTSIATGKTKEVHGITNNLIEDPSTKELILPTSDLRKVKAIWNILSDYRKKVAVLGYRVSWPPEKVNGVIVSERANESDYSSTRYAEPPFMRLCTERIFNSFKETRNIPDMLMEQKWAFDTDYFMSAFAEHLLKNSKFDFFCLYLRGIDVLSHRYWEYMFPEGQNISKEDILKYKDVIKDYYIWCDSMIGELLKIIDKNTTVIIISDHGFKTRVNRKYEYIFSEIDNLLRLNGLDKFNYNSKIVTLENTQRNKGKYKKNIKITGCLSKEEFKAVKESAENILRNIKVTETGQAIFKILNDTEVGFIFEADKEYINNNPEHHILINSQEHKFSDFFKRYPDSSDHDENDAIIIISGKNIRRHQQLRDSSIYDIAPSVLYLTGLPLANDMSGKVLVNAITRDLLNKKPVRHIGTYEKNERETLQEPIRSPVDEENLKERMRSLGYIN